jgi:hypothetical protein
MNPHENKIRRARRMFASILLCQDTCVRVSGRGAGIRMRCMLRRESPKDCGFLMLLKSRTQLHCTSDYNSLAHGRGVGSVLF